MHSRLLFWLYEGNSYFIRLIITSCGVKRCPFMKITNAIVITFVVTSKSWVILFFNPFSQFGIGIYRFSEATALKRNTDHPR